MNRVYLSLAWVLTATILFAQERIGTVLGDRVNLRNGPGLESDVVGVVNYGDSLRVLGREGEWVRVGPPNDFPVWVFSGLLFEEREVRSPVLNLRAGPGTNFPVLGQLRRGDAVEVLETRDDWRRIRATDAVTLWIHQDFLQAPAETAPSMPEPAPNPLPLPTPVPPPAPTPVVIVELKTVERIVEVPVVPTPTPTVVPPDGLNLVPLQGQGTASIRRGVIRAYLLAGASPSRFVLLQVDNDGSERTLAYLRGDDAVLRAYAGRWVSVRGRDFWITGQRLPVTQVDAVELIGGAP